jgi:hypothetical protein
MPGFSARRSHTGSSVNFFLLADVCATLGKYGLNRRRRNARQHSRHDPLQWWDCYPGARPRISTGWC